ncbi:putative colanic acid biosynthesis acetyltransferase [Trinickia sp. NRRL B-1857]|uniref:putative colanic acid biosynthesis acetyltransferase n=1 Tax=Trinickia sp. NRRL B-1857 TaxID=3162879 RepID=UPI003D2C1ABF
MSVASSGASTNAQGEAPETGADAMPPRIQDLSAFKVPADFRGRPGWYVQLWWIADALLFRPSPQVLYGWRRTLLRWFGARVGAGAIIRPSARITYPWKVSIGEHAWIGDDVTLYSLGQIEIGAHAVVSQRSYLCAADHDYRRRTFPIRARAVTIGAQAWVATDVFVAPGVTIGEGAIVGARSTVLRDLPPRMVCYGYPALAVRPRECLDIGHESK